MQSSLKYKNLTPEMTVDEKNIDNKLANVLIWQRYGITLFIFYKGKLLARAGRKATVLIGSCGKRTSINLRYVLEISRPGCRDDINFSKDDCHFGSPAFSFRLRKQPYNDRSVISIETGGVL